jgi:hypothetical protein
MASNLNSEFNYRYQVMGDTPWEKIKQLQNFLEGRKRAAALEECADLKRKAKFLELQSLKDNGALPHLILNCQAEIIEMESVQEDQRHNFDLNRKEMKVIQKLLDELYIIVEPTRMKHPDGTPYTDDEMFEENAANEFTVMIGREIQAEIIANGRPSPAKLRNAMSNPHTFLALQSIGLVPPEAMLLEGNADPLKIELRASPSIVALKMEQQNKEQEKLENT